MKLLSKIQVDASYYTGQYSDGHDRVLHPVTGYQVTVLDDTGRTQIKTFDHDPTAQEVVDAIPAAVDLVPTKKANLEDYLAGPYDIWWRWKQMHAEAVVRSAPAAVLTALTTRENAAWSDLLTVIQAWRTAT